MIYVILAIVCLTAGVILSGSVYALIGGVKTDVALLKVKGATDFQALHARLTAIETAIAGK